MLPCDAHIDIGPFRFECDGHDPGARERAVRHHGGQLTHQSSSPRQVGDVEVTFWTMVDDEGD